MANIEVRIHFGKYRMAKLEQTQEMAWYRN